MANLSAKQQQFVDEYLVCWNAAEAARRAGYSEKTARQQGSRLLTNVDILEAVNKRVTEHAMSANEVLYHLAEIGRGDMGDYLTGGSVSLPDDRSKSMLVRRVKFVKRSIGEMVIEETEFELYDRLRALDLLAKHHDLTNRVKHETWEDQAIADIRAGIITPSAYPEIVEKFGESLAASLFARAGIPVTVGSDSGETRDDERPA